MNSFGKSEDGLISRYINRRVSGRISRWILSRWNDPNPFIATYITFIVGLMSFLFYLFGFELLGGIFIQFSSILDGVDGELARATGKTSLLGGFLDTLFDRFIDFSVLIAIFYTSFTKLYVSTSIFLVLYLVAMFSWFLVSYLHSVVRGLSIKDLFVKRVKRFASRDVRIFILFLSSIFYLSFYGVILSGLLSLAYILYGSIIVYLLLLKR